MKLRIAFFSHLDMNLYLFRLPWMKALREAGHEVCAVMPRGEYFDRFAEEGVGTVPFPMARGSMNPLRLVGTICRLRKVLVRGGYDALHAFTLQGSIIGAPAGRGAGIPHIFCHITGLGYLFTEATLGSRLLRCPVRIMARGAFGSAERVIFQNPDDAAELAGLVDAAKVVIIGGTGVDTDFFAPSAVDPDRIASLRAELGLSTDRLVVTFIGRLLRHKGIAELAEAAVLLAGEFPRLTVLAVGWRDEGNPAVVGEEFIRTAGERAPVRFLGERHDIREILALTDVYALPSYREGTPRTVLEAMAMGKPVVTTDVPGCRQTVEDGVNGLLVPTRDPAALAAAMRRLLIDRGLRVRMGQAGREKAIREFSTKVVVAQVLRLHEGLTPQGRGAG